MFEFYMSMIYLVFFFLGRGGGGVEGSRGCLVLVCARDQFFTSLLFLDILNKKVNNRFRLTFTIILCHLICTCHLLYISHKNS